MAGKPRLHLTEREWKDRRNRQSREWRARNPEKSKARNKRAADYRREWYAENRGWMVSYNRDRHCRKKYGISYAEKQAMLAAQNNTCAICKTPKPATKHEWVVDHDHKTGAVRRILCHPCNLMLGSARDDVAILQAAIEYLKAFR